MWFGKKNDPLHTGVITTSEGLELEVVSMVRWSFSQHISKLQAKIKSRHSFLYRNRSSFIPAAKQTLI